MRKDYYVYMMTNQFNTVIYTGVTNDLLRRVFEHKNDLVRGFTERYRAHKLVYYEHFDNAYNAVSREKLIKGGSRKKKVSLIEAANPSWQELDLG